MTDQPVSAAFSDPVREREADNFGMWIFLVTEAMLFGAVLLGYFILRLKYREAFAGASQQTSLPLGTLNTAVLLTSSFAMVIAVSFAKAGDIGLARRALWVTGVLGVAFLGVKGYEYADDIRRGLLPVFGAFRYAGPDQVHAGLFFNLYLTLTGMHAVHLLIGIALIAWLTLSRRTPAPRQANRIESVGLYWHFIDVVWVFLFPLLYLVQR